MDEINYRELLNPARIAYIQLSLNYEIVSSIQNRGEDIGDYMLEQMLRFFPELNK